MSAQTAAIAEKSSNSQEDALQKELETCQHVLAGISELVQRADPNAAVEAMKRQEVFHAHVSKAKLPPGARERLLSEARQLGFAGCCLKLSDLLRIAVDAAQHGDRGKKFANLSEAKALLQKLRKLTDNEHLIKDIGVRIELAAETDAVGTSVKAKTHKQDTCAKSYAGVEHRRFMRYDDPMIVVRFGRDPTLHRCRNFSMGGLLIEGTSLGLAIGYKVQIHASIEDDATKTVYVCSATVLRIEHDDDPDEATVAVSFPASEGPIMYFAKMHLIKPGDLTPI